MQTVSIKFLRPRLSLESRADAVAISVPDDHTPPDELSGFYFPATASNNSFEATDHPPPLVVVFHGMGGSALSHYMRSMAERLNDAGYPVLLWNHRGAGRSASSCRHLHHPGYTEDVRRLTDYLQKERRDWIGGGMACVAFSLGANLLLKYLAETGEDSAFDWAVSISAPIDMEITSQNLRTGSNRLFDRYLLKKQQSELLRDSAELTAEEREIVKTASSVWDLDDRFTSRRLGYDGAVAFYADNSAEGQMPHIRKPTLLLHAEDDPVVDADVFAAVDWQANDYLFPALVESGGHTGFLCEGGRRWHELAGIAFLNRFAAGAQSP